MSSRRLAARPCARILLRRGLLVLGLLAGCAAPRGPDPAAPLQGARRWAIQLDGLTAPDAVGRLAGTGADLLVIDATRTVRGRESFPIRKVVASLSRDRVCLAYLNVGQAESYRTYWRDHWRAPAAGTPGSPSYLLTVDPDGWSDNYPVAYWDLRWRAVLWGSPGAPLDQALADGFHGVFLDWVLGFEDPVVAAAARAAGVDPARAMAELVRDLRAYARRRRPGFLVVAQNCSGLAARVPEFSGWIDGVAQESLTYGGAAGAGWDDPAAGDQPTPPAATDLLVRRLTALRDAGLPVFTLDYARDPQNAARAREFSRSLGFVPFVSRTPLDRIP